MISFPQFFSPKFYFHAFVVIDIHSISGLALGRYIGEIVPEQKFDFIPPQGNIQFGEFENPLLVWELRKCRYFDCVCSNTKCSICLKLESIPETIGELKKLSELSVGENRLKTLPDSIGYCTALHALSFKANSIAVLPPSFANLQKLKILHANKNQFATFPHGKQSKLLQTQPN